MISPELRQLFDEPPRDFSPTPLWWWSGAKVTRERLEWQMRRFREGGVHNLVVINLAPAGPSFGAPADDPAWFSEEWWDRFTDACEIAEQTGMRLWFYDQIGFSGANLQGAVTHRHPGATGQELRATRTVVRGGRVEEPAAGTTVGAYRLPSGERLPSSDTGVDAPDGTEILLVTAAPTPFDYLDPDAVGHLMEAVHGEYERRIPQYLGNVIAGSFQDELPGTNTWSPRFAAEFRARRGYDLLDHLPVLFAEFGGQGGGQGEPAAKIRGDYYAVRAELTEEALFKPLGTWHEKRGMLLGADQSNPARAGFPAQSTQIYTDYFRTHRWYSAAGSDHEGDSKVHSSMAHLYGHDRVWIEAFHSSGWGGTLEDTYDWLLPFLRSGANLYNPHASYFGTAGGWFEWAPPSTDWRQPYWAQYPDFARAVARIGSIMSWGGYCADVAVLHPTATMQALLPLDLPVQHFGDGRLGERYPEADLAQQHYLELCGTNNWFHTRLGALDRHGVSFDVIDDASVQRAEPSEGRLRVAGLAYSTVLLPSATVLEEETARRLVRLLDAGGRVVVVGAAPAMAAGRGGDDGAVSRLLDHPRLERAADPESAAAAAADSAPAAGHATGDVPLLVRRQDGHGAALVTGAFPNASSYPLRKTDSWLWEDYDFDPARYAQTSTVTVRARLAEAEVWNPATGERRPARITADGEDSRIEVPLEGAPAALVVWREESAAARTAPTRPAPAAAPRKAPDAPSIHADLSAGWTGTLVPTMDNTWGDLALPAASPVAEPQIWTMDWTESDAPSPDWEPARAGYGDRVRTLPPVPADQAPEPLGRDAAARVLSGELPLVPADGDWTVSVHSAARGILDPGHGALGNKGLVPEEFVRVPEPLDGTVARVRAIVETDRRGPAELLVGAAAAKRVWWNGEPLPAAEAGGYLSRARVDLRQDRNLLEYELSGSHLIPGVAAVADSVQLGSYYCLAAPGDFAPRPEFMRLPDGVRPEGPVVYRARFAVDTPARAVLVVGAATAVTVRLDGEVAARQEKVQYYEADWGAVPMYFRHELDLAPGEHTLELAAEAGHPRDALFADLVTDAASADAASADVPSAPVALVSGAGWEVRTGDWRGRTVEHDASWGETQHCRAAVRPHPLPGAAWLRGEPTVGAPAHPLHSTDSAVPAAQRFRFTVPAGTTSLDLPLALPAAIRIAGGEPTALTGHRFDLAEPLPRASTVEITTEPTAVLRGGSAWSGPVRLRTAPAPLPLGDWREAGLAGWSGAVRYTRAVEVPEAAAGTEPVLDLGRVRGSVQVAVDGEPAGRAFCAPYRFPLPAGAAGRTVRVEVTVRNTLAPYLHEATPTAWTFPSQLSSGLLGPVTLRQRPALRAVRDLRPEGPSK
jgi:hypothetical protein